ncbi:MAG: PQQ-binding-like beta-propeller repeat protein, partial [Gemmatimonadaceae bacterium]|nr:PQQ-binding-like beta-propeller repeat protein [Gemmatimonadaceae bacterium]
MLVLGACGVPAPPESGAGADTDWPHYGGAAGGTRYSPLADLHRGNVLRLAVAWQTRAGDVPAEFFGPAGHRAGDRNERGRPVPQRAGAACGTCLAAQMRFESTPLMRDGTLYVSTPRNRVLALDPATGARRWTFDPRVEPAARYAEDFVSRGVAGWTDSRAASGERCARRIFLTTIDARLIALDAADGTPCAEFGDSGHIRLDMPGPGASLAAPSSYSITSPATVINDVVVVGSAVANNARRDVPSGIVRAFDARSGRARWSFDPIPRTPEHPAREQWTPESARTTGGANVWSIMSADPERDLVFLPTSSAAPDFYGGGRPGRNDFANSVVALRGATGAVVWSYQVVRHDLWDYDVAAQPLLFTFRDGGREVPAVAVGTKMGTIFVLDRQTGEPLLPVEKRAVPASDVPGEAAWPTQPFPAQSPPLHGTRLTADSAFGVTDADRIFCRELIARLRNEGIFTPPSFQGTLVWPGFWGGINWDGIAWDPERQRIVTTVKRMAMIAQLHPRSTLGMAPADAGQGTQYMAGLGTPYAMSRAPLVAPSGVPCTPPPWGTLAAVELRSGLLEAQADVRGGDDAGDLLLGVAHQHVLPVHDGADRGGQRGVGADLGGGLHEVPHRLPPRAQRQPRPDRLPGDDPLHRPGSLHHRELGEVVQHHQRHRLAQRGVDGDGDGGAVGRGQLADPIGRVGEPALQQLGIGGYVPSGSGPGPGAGCRSAPSSGRGVSVGSGMSSLRVSGG